MKKKNFNKGITLIALVITIIVLLILAGVAINMATDSNGLFGKANSAAESWNTAVGEESNVIWNLLNTGNNGNNEKQQRGDVELSYAVVDTKTGKQINLRMNIIGVPEYHLDEEFSNNYVKNELLNGKTIEELLILIGELWYPGQGLTAEQAYDDAYVYWWDVEYDEFMTNPDKIIQEEEEYESAVEFFMEEVIWYLENSITEYTADIDFSINLLPELEGKTETEIISIVEGYYNNEKTFEQIVTEVDGASSLDEAIANMNNNIGIKDEDRYIISKDIALRLIAAKAYTNANELLVTKPDNTSENIEWYSKNQIILAYPITEVGSYTFKVLSPSGKVYEETIDVRILLDKPEITVIIEKDKETESQSLSATLKNISESELVWTSSNENVAQIQGTGTTVNIKMKSAGKAKITVACGEYSDSCTIYAVPIPEGFVVSQIPGENTISEGLVIYQGTDAVTGEKGSTLHTVAMETRNQFVWIPVEDINTIIMCKNNSKNSTCNIALQADGTLKCEKHNSTNLCGRLDSYNSSRGNNMINYYYIWTYKRITDLTGWIKHEWSDSKSREPDITEYDSKEENLNLLGLNTADEFLAQLTQDFKEMAISVDKYGGFYVGRYEAGENGASLKNQKVIVSGTETASNSNSNTYVDGGLWYGMYNTLRNSTAVDKTEVNTYMMWRMFT